MDDRLIHPHRATKQRTASQQPLDASPLVQRAAPVGIERCVVRLDRCSDLLRVIAGQQGYPHLVFSAGQRPVERDEDQRRVIGTMLVLAFPRPLQNFSPRIASALVVAENNALGKLGEFRLSSDGCVNSRFWSLTPRSYRGPEAGRSQ